MCKEAREEESHMTSGQCKVYGDLTHNFSNLNDDNNLVKFFSEVLARRDQLELLTSGDGGVTTDDANSVLCGQDKPIHR